MIIAGFIASIYNSNGDNNYDTSQIPNSEIVLVAKAQIGMRVATNSGLGMVLKNMSLGVLVLLVGVEINVAI